MTRNLIGFAVLSTTFLAACAGSQISDESTNVPLVQAEVTPFATKSQPASQPTPLPAEAPSSAEDDQAQGESFEATIYRDDEAGFQFAYPASWTPGYGEEGTRGRTASLDAPDGTGMGITVYLWEPVNDLDARLDVRRQAWTGSGMTILSEQEMATASGHRLVQVMLQTSTGEQASFALTTVGDRYLELGANFSPDLLAEIAGTLSIDSGTPAAVPVESDPVPDPPAPDPAPIPAVAALPLPGDKIAFSHAVRLDPTDPSPSGGACHIFVMNGDGTGAIDLTPGDRSCNSDPAFSPDGTLIAYVAGFPNRGASSMLMAMGADRSNPREVASRRYFQTYGPLIWSNDGTRIAIHFPGDFLWHVHTISDGEEVAALDLLPPEEWSLPELSPDGSYRAEFCQTNPDNTSEYRLCLTDLGDSSQITLSGPLTNLIRRSASWSPDGAWIVFQGDDGIYAIRPDGSSLQKIAGGLQPDWQP